MRALPLGLPFQGRWLGAAETERLSRICDNLSVCFADSTPTPFVPSGHFPLIGGIGPWEGEPLDIKNAPCGCTERFLSYEPGRDQ